MPSTGGGETELSCCDHYTHAKEVCSKSARGAPESQDNTNELKSCKEDPISLDEKRTQSGVPVG